MSETLYRLKPVVWSQMRPDLWEAWIGEWQLRVRPSLSGRAWSWMALHQFGDDPMEARRTYETPAAAQGAAEDEVREVLLKAFEPVTQ